MRFLVDMPLSPMLSAWLTGRGHDAAHASELGLSRAPDTAILARARAEQRVIVTADLDYPRLFALAHLEGPGLILFRGGDYSEAESRERLEDVLKVIPIEDLPRSIPPPRSLPVLATCRQRILGRSWD